MLKKKTLKKKPLVKKAKRLAHKLAPKTKPVVRKPAVSVKPKKTIKVKQPKPKLTAPAVPVAPAVVVPIAAIKKEAAWPVAPLKKEAPVITPAKKEAPVVIKEAPPAPVIKKEIPVPIAPSLKELELTLPITLKDLAVKLQEKPSTLIKLLMDMKMMVGINQVLEEPIANSLCQKYGFKIKEAASEEELLLAAYKKIDAPKDLVPRPPIVTFMGHVDHGKTSLLDAIRKTKVADSEHGGITQHIGAYRVNLAHGDIAFLDTPGHEAFTAMRARGASITDIVVLVVAADDGVMPQTQEAIDHARAAGVPIIVAVNKIDKPQANADKVKSQLSELDLAAEDWGGKTITVPVSAKTGAGIDNLLEMILLEAQMLELKANPKRPASGVVVEARMSKGRGPVSTLLIQNGTLRLNENIIVGVFYGKIRAMFNDHGQSVSEAHASFPVEVLGISGIPQAGEPFFVIEDDNQAKELALKRQENQRQEKTKAVKRISLEELHTQIVEGKLKELKLIIKADVQGSLEAIKDVLGKLKSEEIKMDIIHQGVGNINSSDAILAVASNGLILGFNVVVDALAQEIINKEGLDVRTYNIIYELANDIKAALEGMLEPRLKKVFLGRAEVRKVFKLSRAGTVAGCFVVKGRFTRIASVSLLRNGEVIFEGKLSSLKRFKDDVKEVAEGFECGMSLGGFDNLQEGDLIEAYEVEKIVRRL